MRITTIYSRLAYLFSIVLISLLTSCSIGEEDIDKDLRFAINTSPHSKGIAYYVMPDSDNYTTIPQDPKNPITASKVALGAQLFHESGFGTVGELPDYRQTYSCASCHHAGAGFQANMAQGIGEGGVGFGVLGEGRTAGKTVAADKIDALQLRPTSILNITFQTNLSWNGAFGATGVNEGTMDAWPLEGPISINRLGYEGVETQAIAGLDIHRHDIGSAMIEELGYQELFDEAFGDVDIDQRYNNHTAGLAIAAYERTVMANQAPFQKWLKGDDGAMTVDEKAGATLFFGKGNCSSCHNGPNLANTEFHAIGMDDFDPSQIIAFESSDSSRLGRASFTKQKQDEYKFKVPQLYNLKDSPFYGHGASFHSVRDVIAYKNTATAQHDRVPDTQISDDFVPLDLTEQEVDLITTFVMDALYDPDLYRYVPMDVKSGSCIPNNDWLSKSQLGCL